MSEFSEQLIKARKAAGMTQEQLADAIHVSRPMISHWEKGRYVPDINTIGQLSKVLNWQFFDYTNDESILSEDEKAPGLADAMDVDKEIPGQNGDETEDIEKVSDSKEADAEVVESKASSSKRTGWIIGGIALLCVLAFAAWMIIRNSSNSSPADQIDQEAAVTYRMEDFAPKTETASDAANLKVSCAVSTVEMGASPFCMYVFSFESLNNYAVDVKLVENVLVLEDNFVLYQQNQETLEELEVDTHINAYGVFEYTGGFPVQEKMPLWTGIRLTGLDEAGNEVVFTSYQEF